MATRYNVIVQREEYDEASGKVTGRAGYRIDAYGLLQEDRLAEALRECSDDLAAEISARYAGTLHYPVQQRGYDRDMAPVERARALPAELAATDNA